MSYTPKSYAITDFVDYVSPSPARSKKAPSTCTKDACNGALILPRTLLDVVRCTVGPDKVGALSTAVAGADSRAAVGFFARVINTDEGREGGDGASREGMYASGRRLEASG